MDGSQIKTLFESLVDDQLADDDAAYNLMDVAKVQIEESRDWAILKAVDTSKTRSSGDTYQTSKALPTAFRAALEVYLGTSRIMLRRIPFNKLEEYKDVEGFYAIDYANDVYYITGTATQSETIYFNYLKTTTTMASGTTWPFPTRFHPILAYKMAELFYPVDAGDKGRSWDDRWRVQYNELFQQMIYWDTKIRQSEAENDHNFGPSLARHDVVDIDNI